MRAYSMVLWVRVLAARDGGMATSEAAEAFAVSAARAAQREDVRPAAPRSAGIPRHHGPCRSGSHDPE